MSLQLQLGFLDSVGTPEMMMIMFVVLMLFGKEKLPGLARGLGKAIREFKKATGNLQEELKRNIEDLPSLDQSSLPKKSAPVPKPEPRSDIDTSHPQIPKDDNQYKNL